MAAWTGTSNIWRGMSSLSFLVSARPARWRVVAVDDDAERVDRLAVDEDVQLDEVARAIADLLVVHRGVALGAALELVVEVDDDLGERQLEVSSARAWGRGTPCPGSVPRWLVRQLHERADVGRSGVTMLSLTHGSAIDSISRGLGQQGRVLDDDLARAVRRASTMYSTDGARGDDVEVELALQPLLHDLHVQQAEEAAAEAEAERDRATRARS